MGAGARVGRTLSTHMGARTSVRAREINKDVEDNQIGLSREVADPTGILRRFHASRDVVQTSVSGHGTQARGSCIFLMFFMDDDGNGDIRGTRVPCHDCRGRSFGRVFLQGTLHLPDAWTYVLLEDAEGARPLAASGATRAAPDEYVFRNLHDPSASLYKLSKKTSENSRESDRVGNFSQDDGRFVTKARHFAMILIYLPREWKRYPYPC